MYFFIFGAVAYIFKTKFRQTTQHYKAAIAQTITIYSKLHDITRQICNTTMIRLMAHYPGQPRYAQWHYQKISLKLTSSV